MLVPFDVCVICFKVGKKRDRGVHEEEQKAKVIY